MKLLGGLLIFLGIRLFFPEMGERVPWEMKLIAVLLILAGIAIFIFISIKKRKKPIEPPEPPSLYEQAGLLSGEGLGIGWERTKEVNGVRPPGKWLKYNSDRHLITIGPTGSGKGSTQQIITLLWDDASSLIIDVKGQMCVVTTRFRATDRGHEVVCLNPFDVLGLPTSTYNPLAHINPQSITFASDCRRIAEGLVDIVKADHWEVSALDFVTMLIMWVVKYEDEKNLVRVRQLLNLPDDLRRELFRKISLCDDAALAEGAGRYVSDSNEVRDCIQTAAVQLGFMRDEAIARILIGGANEISFANLKRKKMTVYVIIPPELLHTHGKFLRLIVMSALGELLREKTQPDQPILFMLDEFAQLGHMALIENAASIVRDYKIRLWIILQNLPQLKDLYKAQWESFLSSAGIVQLFTPNDMQTAEYFSKRSGIRQKKQLSGSESSTSGSSPGGASSSSGATLTTTYVDAPVYTPQDLLGIEPWFEFLFCAGLSDAMLACRGPYWKQPWAQGRYDPDPYHMTTEERERFEAHARSSKTLLDAVKPSLPAVSFSTV